MRISVEKGALVYTNRAASRPAERRSYYGNDTFGFGDTLIIFEKKDGAVTRLRVDTGSGHNVLAREARGWVRRAPPASIPSKKVPVRAKTQYKKGRP